MERTVLYGTSSTADATYNQQQRSHFDLSSLLAASPTRPVKLLAPHLHFLVAITQLRSSSTHSRLADPCLLLSNLRLAVTAYVRLDWL